MWRGQDFSAVGGHRWRYPPIKARALLTLFTLPNPDETMRRRCLTTRILSGLPHKHCHCGSDPDPATAVPDLTSTACIKLNERILLLSMFEPIACTTPDNCARPAQRGEAAGRPTVNFVHRSATSLVC